MLAPTKELKDGEKLDIDGVRFVFQRTMNNDAPAEMATYFAERKVRHIPEIVNSSLHYIIPARGSPARDARAWTDGLTTAIGRFDGATILSSAHAWPRFGRVATIAFMFSDAGETVRVGVANGVRVHHAGASATPVDAEEVITRKAMLDNIYKNSQTAMTAAPQITGDSTVVNRFSDWFDRPDPTFLVVTR
jgi:alkyl sulfatase BDS1-like metallo-beta-lactamase superfamily hydrolase